MPPSRTALAKLKGEWAELQFMTRALALGLRVARVYGDSARYDFFVDAGGRLSRVQIKSAWRARHSAYCVGAQRGAPLGKVPYRTQELDFVIGYVVPEEAWYVVPAAVLARQRQFWVYPQRPNSRGRFEQYRDAWRLLGPIPAEKRFDLNACAEPEWPPSGISESPSQSSPKVSS